MTTSCKVSICVPTYNRPELLVECLDSCLAQTHANIEILIGDDSSDTRTQQLIAARYAHDARIRYVKNGPSLGQARNVASLFARATGDKIALIHDDDYFTSDGIETLLALWHRHPQLEVAFADQYEVDAHGNFDATTSAAVNAAFHRNTAAQGLQRQPGRTGLVQMFPNNGWMANADLVKRISYRDDVGTCCDYVFGAELCLAASQVYYLHRYVSYYRKTDVSVSGRTRGSACSASLTAFEFVSRLTLDASLEPARRLALRRLAPNVVSLYAKNDAPLAALRVAFVHLYAYAYGLDARLYYHLSLIARACIPMKWRGLPPSATRFP
ncbi:glycosyltransferase family 2 protein [Paraburkholderia phymatum]|uniref:Glycosyl transferase family 2 n=1 Tax=Paraburkholderia phymatum (strain DSM 17167 / CIP 108236 / LMG 21445 / STM815) TaxID=391038 RepID=B2JHR6_PARP8|nr:glycosyltransferase family 2 protein [Paraburkholderia phymatum]ACC70408.1 glycosyl transferase family 2 [Paraburkholderia phymatum STM815]